MSSQSDVVETGYLFGGFADEFWSRVIVGVPGPTPSSSSGKALTGCPPECGAAAEKRWDRQRGGT